MSHTLLISIAFITSILGTMLMQRVAFRFDILDRPNGNPRKIHKTPIPFLGGVAVYVAFLITMLVALSLGILPQGSILAKHLWGLLLGGGVIAIGGFLDDKYNLPPKKQVIAPLLATIVLMITGVGIESISNPFGGQWFLDQFQVPLFHIGELPYKITLLADIFTFVWMMGMMYTTKFFDGLDGLVSGITIIGAVTIFYSSLLDKINQPETAMVALIVAACFGGFLIFNFNPAKIYLGEAGSILAGFFLGALAIIVESKVTTTLVVLSLPFLDIIWVIVRRVIIEKRSPFSADKKHLHFRLIDAGMSHRQAVLFMYAWAIICGILAILYQGQAQWYILVLTMVAMVALGTYLVSKTKQL